MKTDKMTVEEDVELGSAPVQIGNYVFRVGHESYLATYESGSLEAVQEIVRENEDLPETVLTWNRKDSLVYDEQGRNVGYVISPRTVLATAVPAGKESV